MPSDLFMSLPKTRSEDEFEYMCADVLSMIYGIPFYKYGRKGQKQNGIDLYEVSSQEVYIVAQCKNYHCCSYEDLQNQIRKDIESAKQLSFSIKLFIVMTALNRDITIQNTILNIDAQFEIRILFWEDIQIELCKNKNLLYKYYPQYLENGIVPYACRNELIVNLQIIKKQVEKLSSDYKYYKVGDKEYSDGIVYNECICIENALRYIDYLHNEWYLQLEKKQISTLIEKIMKIKPSFYDEFTDGTGISMICTISDFINYFSDYEKKKLFVTYCDEIIEKIKEL